MNTTYNEMTDAQLDEVVKAAEIVRDNFEGVNIDTIKEITQVDENTDLIAGKVLAPVDSNNFLDAISKPLEEKMDRIIDGKEVLLTEEENEDVEKSITTTAAEAARDNYNLSEEEMMNMVDLIMKFRKDPNYPVFKNLPEIMKQSVRELAMSNGIPANGWNRLARMVLEEFVADSNFDATFVDLQKAIDDALNIPSLTDMYSEHTKNVMDKYIPEMAERIKDEAPDKAERLLAVKEAFTKSYTFSFAKESYDSNSRVRKSIRRWETELDKVIDSFNFNNDKSNFRMNDAKELPIVLEHILISEPNLTAKMYKENNEEVPQKYIDLINMKITKEDIAKFCILVCKSCMNYNPHEIIDASYMYYLLKNIIMLKHTQEAKTDFAVELISNICDTITFIRNKEAEHNESLDKSKLSKKRGSNK